MSPHVTTSLHKISPRAWCLAKHLELVCFPYSKVQDKSSRTHWTYFGRNEWMKVVQIRQYFWKSLQPTELCEDSKIFKIWGPGKKVKSPFRNNIFTYFYKSRISPWSYWNLQQVFSPTDFLLAPRFKSIGWQSLRNIWRCKLLRILRIPNPSFFWRVKPWNPMILRVETIQYTSMSCLFVLVDPPYRFPCDGKDLSSCTRTPTSISERSNVYWFGGYRWTLCIACCLHLFTYFFRWK